MGGGKNYQRIRKEVETMRTYQSIAEVVQSIGLPFSYRAFPIGNAPSSPPYVLYFYENNDDVMADNENYVKVENLVIELYTIEKDFEQEENVENVLKENKLTYSKDEEYIEQTLMYRITYEMEVLLNNG